MNKRTKMLMAMFFLLAGTALAQTEVRVFYIDFGQNNVTNQGYLTNMQTVTSGTICTVRERELLIRPMP